MLSTNGTLKDVAAFLQVEERTLKRWNVERPPRIAFYCDGDTLLVVVEQEGKGACHTGEFSCFYRPFGSA